MFGAVPDEARCGLLAERRRAEGSGQRQRDVAVLLVGHSPAALRREPVLVGLPQRHPGQGVAALADQAAGHVAVIGPGVGTVQPALQDQPDGGQGDRPEDDAGGGEEEGLDGVAALEDAAVDSGDGQRQVLAGELGGQAQQAAVAVHAAGGQPDSGVAGGQHEPGAADDGGEGPAGPGTRFDAELAAVRREQHHEHQRNHHEGQHVDEPGPHHAGVRPVGVLRNPGEQGQVDGGHGRHGELEGDRDPQGEPAAVPHAVGADEQQHHGHHRQREAQRPRETGAAGLQAGGVDGAAAISVPAGSAWAAD